MSEQKQLNLSGKYVLNLPADYAMPDGEEMARIRQQFEEAMSSPNQGLLVAPPGCTVAPLDAGATQAQMERLLMLLELTDKERSFVRAALTIDTARDLFAVLADYLEEKDNRTSERFRAMAATEAFDTASSHS